MSAQRRSPAVLVLGFVLLSFYTRVPFGQIGPLAPSAGFNSAVVTLLGMLPPLGMGLAAPFVPALLRRAGEDRLLFWASLAALVGAVGRCFDLVGLIVGTCVTALAIGVINVLIPVFVRRRFPGPRSGPVFGAYAFAMGLGSALAAAVAVPVASASGRWELAIATAVLPAVMAVVGGALMLDRRSTDRNSSDASEPTGEPIADESVAEQLADEAKVAKSWLAWSLLCFFGVQTLLFYGLLAWLPSILVDGGRSAGTAATGQTILILGIALGGFAAPLLGGPRPSQTGVVAAIIAACAIGMVGLAYAESLALGVWVPLLGLGLGGGQALPSVLYAHRGTRHAHTAALSAFAQTGGFLVAAFGPILMSAANRASGSWTVPLVGLAVLCAGNLALSWRGSRNRPASSDKNAPAAEKVRSTTLAS